MKKETNKHIFLFLSIGLMLFFLTFSGAVLSPSQQALVILKFKGLSIIPSLKQASIPTVLVFGIFFLVLCRKGKIHRGFRVFFPLNIIIWGNFSLVCPE